MRLILILEDNQVKVVSIKHATSTLSKFLKDQNIIKPLETIQKSIEYFSFNLDFEMTM